MLQIQAYRVTYKTDDKALNGDASIRIFGEAPVKFRQVIRLCPLPTDWQYTGSPRFLCLLQGPVRNYKLP